MAPLTEVLPTRFGVGNCRVFICPFSGDRHLKHCPTTRLKHTIELSAFEIDAKYWKSLRQKSPHKGRGLWCSGRHFLDLHALCPGLVYFAFGQAKSYSETKANDT